LPKGAKTVKISTVCENIRKIERAE